MSQYMLIALDDFARVFPLFLAGIVIGALLKDPKIKVGDFLRTVTTAGMAAMTASTIWLVIAKVIK